MSLSNARLLSAIDQYAPRFNDAFHLQQWQRRGGEGASRRPRAGRDSG
jgi:hypothetical protein